MGQILEITKEDMTVEEKPIEVETVELMKWETIKGLFQARMVLFGYKLVEFFMPKGYQWGYFTEPTTATLHWKDVNGKTHNRMMVYPVEYKDVEVPEYPDNGGVLLFTKDSNPIHIINYLQKENTELKNKYSGNK